MKSQKSFEKNGGKLYLVGTPIGNLGDMTFRAVEILRQVDWIAAEDTRNTKKLCNHFQITTPLFSYHEHNERASSQKILEKLAQGAQIAIVSDAGMPAISDPGEEVVKQAVAAGYDVIPIPGANAALSAVVASGLKVQPFLFYGFLSRKKKEREEQLETLKSERATILFYEAPHRMKETLLAMERHFGSERQIVLARELTKRYEEFLRGTIREAVDWVTEGVVRGEFCLVVQGFTGEIQESASESWWAELSLVEHVDQCIKKENISTKEAIRLVADTRGLSKRLVYQQYHHESK